MNKRVSLYVLIAFLIVLAILKFSIVQTAEYPDYDAFFGIRQVEHIHQNLLPIIDDELSYQGRLQANSIGFYLITAIIAIFIPSILLFKYASILISLVVLFFLYKISESLFSNRFISLFLVLLAGLSPSLFAAHLNTLTPSAIFLILYVLLLYFFIHIEKYRGAFLFTVVIAVLTSPLSLIFILGLVFYGAILKIESLSIKPIEFELFTFTIVFSLWYHLLIYKKLILNAGVGAVSQTVPQAVLLSSFQNFSPALAVVFIGIIPLLFGMYGTYATLFEKRQRKLLFIVAQFIAFSLLLWLGLVPVQDGLLYVAITLLLLGGYTMQRADAVLRKTVVPQTRIFVLIGLLIIVFVSFIPTIFLDREVFVNAPSTEEVRLLNNANAILPEDTTILGHIQDGHLITALAKRRNFYDENYILAPNVERRYADARKMLLARSQSTILSLAQLYGIDYIYLSPSLIESIPSTPLFTESNCFNPLLREGNSTLYEITCQLE